MLLCCIYFIFFITSAGYLGLCVSPRVTPRLLSDNQAGRCRQNGAATKRMGINNIADSCAAIGSLELYCLFVTSRE